jgi:adenylate kinase family enzyme
VETRVPPPPIQNWPVRSSISWIREMQEKSPKKNLHIVIGGIPGSGRRTFAAIVANEVQSKLLVVNTDQITDDKWEATILQVLRQALLSGHMIAWNGKKGLQKVHPNVNSHHRIQFFIAGLKEYPSINIGIVQLRIEIPTLTKELRKELWAKLVPISKQWPQEDFEKLMMRRQTTVGQIANVEAQNVKNIDQAYRLLKKDSLNHFNELAQPLDSGFQLKDLILPDRMHHQIQQFLFEAQDRTKLWEQPQFHRLFPQGQGLMALFVGPPGTGKTMAAQVLANELKLDIFRIDLSKLVSKYVGETSKNIEHILSTAEKMDIVLFFDEADALFGKRTEIKDAHDRFANTDTNFLLQAIEEYPGIAILASNQKGNIDGGFMRRFRYVLKFPEPKKEQRLQLWNKILEQLLENVETTFIDRELAYLAESFETTGAQVKYAILSAIFESRQQNKPLGFEHLLNGLEREFQKEGRGLGQNIEEILKYHQP